MSAQPNQSGHRSEIHLAQGRLPGNLLVGKRVGQFLFLGAMSPHDLSSGRLVTSLSQLPKEASRTKTGNMVTDIQEDRARAQAWVIYSNLAQILSQHGSSIDNLLRQRIFLADLRDLAAVERVMDIFLPGDKPATTIVQVPTQGVHPQMCLQIDCIALAPLPDFKKQTIYVPELIQGRYPHATRAGQFVFVSNMVGINPQTGKLTVSLSELGSEAGRFADCRFYSVKEEAILAQAWFVFQNINKVLGNEGASLSDVLKVNGWLGVSMREFAPIMSVREVFFPKKEAMPASASIGISSLAQDGAFLGYDCIALVPPRDGNGYHKKVSDIGALVAMYVLGVRAGPLVFTCGEVPIDVRTPKVVTSFEDLEDEGKFLALGSMHAHASVQARGWFVYKKLGSYLAEYGASFPDVVHQTVFMRNPADYPSLERVASLFFGVKIPPTTVIPVTDTSPYPEAMIEIEMIAALPS